MKLTKSKLKQIIKEEIQNLTLLGEIVQSSEGDPELDLLKFGNNQQNAFGYLTTLDDNNLSDALDIIKRKSQDFDVYNLGIERAIEVIRKIEKIESLHPLEEKKKKPSAGLSKKKKSDVVKKARKGKDIGKKGKNFDKVADKAAKKYGSKEAGEKVAAAAMWKNMKR